MEGWETYGREVPTVRTWGHARKGRVMENGKGQQWEPPQGKEEQLDGKEETVMWGHLQEEPREG